MSYYAPRISIIVPVYNVEAFIGQCLNSLVNQNLDHYEIICVNDGSPDGSRGIVEEFRKDYTYIKLIDQENQGLSGARNTGIQHALGEYIMFVDSDDFLEPNVLGELYAIAIEKKLDILDFKVSSFSDNSKKEWRKYFYCNDVVGGKEFFEQFVNKYKVQPSVSAWSHLYKRALITNNGLQFVKNRYYEDLPFTAEMYLLADRVYFHNKFIYNYRSNTTSITRSKIKVKNIEDLLFISSLIYKLSLKYNVKIPTDNFFRPLIKNLIKLAKQGNLDIVLTLFRKNIFKEFKFLLFDNRNRFMYRLLTINSFYFLFLTLLKFINKINKNNG